MVGERNAPAKKVMEKNILIQILENIYPHYYNLKTFITRNFLLFFLTVFAFIYTIFISYVFYFNPYNVLYYAQSIIIFFTVFVLFSGLLIAYNPKEFLRSETALSIITFFGTFLLLCAVFAIVYNLSLFILHKTPQKNSVFAILMVLTLLTITYKLINQFLFKDRKKDKTTKFLYDVVFYIPCLVSDTIELMQKNFQMYENSLYILIPVFVFSMAYYYAWPFLTNTENEPDHPLHLLGSKQSLEKNVVHIPQKSLKQRILNSKPIFEREVLKLNKTIEDEITLYGELFQTHKPLFDKSQLFKNIKFIKTPSEFKTVDEECDGTLSCGENNNMKCDGEPILDVYGMNVKCTSKDGLLDTLFKSIKDSVKFYTDSAKTNKVSLQEYCESSDGLGHTNVGVKCIDYNDYLDTSFVGDTKSGVSGIKYVCNDLSYNDDEKYKPILGYTDSNDSQISFDCALPPEINLEEGFNSMVHQLDVNLQNTDLLNDFNDTERDLIQNMIISEESNFKQALMQFRDDPKKFKAFVLSYFASNQKYMSILDKINKYSNETKREMNQEISSLVKYINSMSGIHDYNYHYGISFWIYFDPELMQIRDTNKVGLIMNYANAPKIYYDYKSSELVVETKYFDKSLNRDMKKSIYKTKEILFQKWNSFVINYYYGTLDIFINNNLVFTQSGIAPYIEEKDNELIFGSNDEPLLNSGICNIHYKNYPYNLSEIRDIYKNHSNPCM